MPISTIPNTPPHHNTGAETLLRSPHARARSRWFEQRTPPANTTMVSASSQPDAETAPLMMNGNHHAAESSTPLRNKASGVGSSNTASCSMTRMCLISGIILMLLGGAFVAVRDESQMVSKWLNIISRWQEGIPPDAREKWFFVTGTSPHALERACQKHSAYRIQNKQVSMETVESITFALMTRYAKSENTIVCGLPPRSFAELDALGFSIIVYVENGFQASFDGRFASWARARGFENEIEEQIDESCLKRRIETKRKYSCTIKEIGVLRAATIWRKLTDEVKTKQGPYFQVVDLIDGGGQTNGRAEDDTEENPVAIQRRNDYAHQPLIKQLAESHLRLPIDELKMSISSIPDKPALPVIDAGYCKVVRTVTEPDFRGPKAICLPTFVVIGAQKSGSDELTVWLNRNKFNRRMDGGVEIHFFDCLGRGRGEDRFSCERKRSYIMQDRQREVRETLLPSDNNTVPTDFSWVIEREKSPFLDDKLWLSYLRLGHLNQRDFYKEPSRTLVFEKTPSYLDMADPRDVVRLLPRGKFVIITRDPVPRLLSAYFQFCDNPEKDEGDCSIEEFNTFALDLCAGKLDLETPGPRQKRKIAFARAAQHGEYANYLEKWIKYFWVDDETMPDKQFLIFDHHHFKYVPLAVMFSIESFTGNRGPIRHYKYEPHFKNGYYTLGDYTKANHPSHKEEMPVHVKEALEKFYRPSVLRLRELLSKKNGPLLFGSVWEPFPQEYMSPHPDLFQGNTRFQYPPWMKLNV